MTGPPQSNRVLLVDDDLFFTARILSVLRRLGYSATSVRTADQAMELCGDRPDLVIFNLGSPRLGGVDTIARLRGAGAQRLLAFLSHVSIPAVRDQAIAAGADRIVPNSAISQRLPEILARLFAGQDLPPDLDSDET
jgi:CheY-like chemotaxis protein